MSDELDLMRQQILEAICSVRVPVKGAGLLYAAKDGTMPIFDADDDWAGLIADAVLPLLSAAEAERDDLQRRLDNVRALNERWRNEARHMQIAGGESPRPLDYSEGHYIGTLKGYLARADDLLAILDVPQTDGGDGR